MPRHPFPHSMSLLKAMVEDAPPLAPQPTLNAARETYDRYLRMPPGQGEEVEDVLIAFGRILWPYRKAFEVLVRKEFEAHDADRFTTRLDPDLAPRYLALRANGGTLTDLHDAQRVSTQFAPEERGRLCAALVHARRDAEAHTRTAIATDEAPYRKLIHEFQAIQHELDQHLAALRRLADRAADHEDVHREIRETVRQFERGLAHLAREPEAQEICAVVETMEARHPELGHPPGRSRIFA